MKCPDCKKDFTSKARFDKHIAEKICKKSYCEICKKQYQDVSALIIHKKSKMHKSAEENVPEQQEPNSDFCDKLIKDNEELKTKLDTLLSLFGVLTNQQPQNTNTTVNNITNINVVIILSEDFKEKEAERFLKYTEKDLTKRTIITKSTRQICQDNCEGIIEKSDRECKTVTIKGIPYPTKLVYQAITLKLSEVMNDVNKRINSMETKDEEKLRAMANIIYSFLDEDDKRETPLNRRWASPKYQFTMEELEDYIRIGIPTKKIKL